MLFLSAILWGFGITIQNISGQNLGSFTVTTIKTLGGFLIFIVALLTKQKFNKQAIIVGVVLGVVMFAGNVLQQIGIVYSTIGKASFITALYVVFVPILGLFFGNKTKMHVWVGIGIAAIGTYFLCINETFILQLGDITLFLCAIVFGLQIVIIGKYVNDVDPIALAAVQTITACVLSGICMFIFETPDINVIKDVWLELAYVCLLSCAFGTTSQIIFQQYVEPSTAGIIMSFESVFGVIGGFLILHQTLTVREMFGCILIFIAVLIAQKE